MPIPIYTIDAFTDQAFSGNPAAVCWLDAARDADWMQSVAAELNLSETAFVSAHPDGFALRWFTPTIEVPLCGHATLASAHMLFTSGRASAEAPIRFQTKSGELRAEQTDRGAIEIELPASGCEEATPPDLLLGALGTTPAESSRVVGDSQLHPNWIFRLANEEAVRSAAPDFSALQTPDSPAFMLTAESKIGGLDFVSRFFAPGVGIDEDPVTGFAHSCLGPFWRERTGRDHFTARQVSARGGTLSVSVIGDRVQLRGHAVTVIEGTLLA